MSTSKFNVALRSRSPFEAIDLGFALINKNLKAVYLPWLILIAVVYTPLCWLLSGYPSLLFFLFSLTVPFFERACLFSLSRAVFGTIPSVKETLRSWPNACKKGFFMQTFFLRFSPTRIYYLPTWQLEHLKGKASKNRRQILGRGMGGSAISCSVIMAIFEMVLMLGLLLFIASFIPNELIQELFSDYAIDSDPASFPTGVTLFVVLLYFITVLLIRPLLVACQFSLYLNRRMELEGWDIELNFRALSERIRGKGMTLVILSLIFFSFSPKVMAETAPLSPKEAITNVKEDHVFGYTKQVKTLQLKSSESKPIKSEKFEFNGLAIFGKVVVLGLLFVMLTYVFIILMKHRKERLSNQKQSSLEPPPSTIMGMKITAESLPSNLVKEALLFWASGEKRKAYSLIYRGALFHLAHNFGLELQPSFTEEDCMNSALKLKNRQVRRFFVKLTLDWSHFAYGEVEPSSSQFETLCDQWSQVLGRSDEK